MARLTPLHATAASLAGCETGRYKFCIHTGVVMAGSVDGGRTFRLRMPPLHMFLIGEWSSVAY